MDKSGIIWIIVAAMNAPTTTPATSTYRTPDGQLIHNVIFNPDSGYYKWKDDQGKPCLLKANRFEEMMTPIPDNVDPAAEGGDRTKVVSCGPKAPNAPKVSINVPARSLVIQYPSEVDFSKLTQMQMYALQMYLSDSAEAVTDFLQDGVAEKFVSLLGDLADKADRYPCDLTVVWRDKADAVDQTNVVKFARPVNGELLVDCPVGSVSDGYHTFDELYEHRCLLFLGLMAMTAEAHPGTGSAWFSEKLSDGSKWGGWFIAGLKTPVGDISYHLPGRMWGEAKSTRAEELEKAPPYDDHNSEDVVARLYGVLGTVAPEAIKPLKAPSRRFKPKLVLRDARENYDLVEAAQKAAQDKDERFPRVEWAETNGMPEHQKSDLLPHRQRVIAEKVELDEKIAKLAAFIQTNPMFHELDKAEQLRLRVQINPMRQYSGILADRIEAFWLPDTLTDETRDLPDFGFPDLLDDAPKSADESPKVDFAPPSEEQVQEDSDINSGSGDTKPIEDYEL